MVSNTMGDTSQVRRKHGQRDIGVEESIDADSCITTGGPKIECRKTEARLLDSDRSERDSDRSPIFHKFFWVRILSVPTPFPPNPR